MDGRRISGRAPLVSEDGKTPMFVGPPWSIVGVGADEMSAVRESMKGTWEKLGGPKSFLGLPLGNQIEVSKANGQYQSHFRSGTLNIATSGGPPRVDSKDVVNVTLLGIECVRRHLRCGYRLWSIRWLCVHKAFPRQQHVIYGTSRA